jgi:hypothetical protein
LTDPQPPIQSTVADLEPITVRLIEDSEGPLFCQFIQRYHDLGYRVPVGTNLRYFIESGDPHSGGDAMDESCMEDG